MCLLHLTFHFEDNKKFVKSYAIESIKHAVFIGTGDLILFSWIMLKVPFLLLGCFSVPKELSWFNKRQPFMSIVCQNKYLVFYFLAAKLSFSNVLPWTSTLDLCFKFIRVAWKSIVLMCWLICWEVYSLHLKELLLQCQLIMSLYLSVPCIMCGKPFCNPLLPHSQVMLFPFFQSKDILTLEKVILLQL